MAPMTVPMGIWSASCNWCVVIVVITGQSWNRDPELICENQAGLPVYMQALSGNSNDTKALPRPFVAI